MKNTETTAVTAALTIRAEYRILHQEHKRLYSLLDGAVTSREHSQLNAEIQLLERKMRRLEQKLISTFLR
jgi:predicted  nucleic acid-binding Zn-ribbon protein